MSVDGKLALPSKKQVKLSSLEDFKRVHQLRDFYDAVLVGINTVLLDDPKLTVKQEFVPQPKHPIRVVLDSKGRTPETAEVLNGIAETLIIMSEDYKSNDIKFKNAEIIYCPTETSEFLLLPKLLSILKARGIENLLVEGGGTVIYQFLKHGLVDELYVFISNVIIGGSESPTMANGKGPKTIDDLISLNLLSLEQLGDGILLKYRPG
jgi:2,5-diamino-6-(ribosylamino)-4(3H)-pyrimidinone 5'-phosphate reductase